eukprot:CAMPEP_0119118782 /NCGR_PEP_ID=MMETSP1310-20130426/535_1 /TAXON_ID=464262 /ORGANISM="Genus nov. species nov., Strain RCC2339" /LENGTH=1158 /DNA_ID=CAMNT_0007108173 /DNA_START=20 /DNA_END=3496 /DNA_ORIENTATION=-
MKVGGITAVVLVVIALTGSATAITRNYFIQAEEVLHDYAPQQRNVVYNREFTPYEETFVTPTVELGRNITFGRLMWKIQMFEYTDDTYTQRVQRTPEWEHLGTVGPVIRGQVGDIIKVHYRNMASVPLTLHPHGVAYLKDSEGTPYKDGTTGDDRADNAVAPDGGTHIYTWLANSEAGPGPNEGSSKVWLYHSHFSTLFNVNAGAFGVIIITEANRATASDNLRPDDVDQEVVLFMHNFDEVSSSLFDKNMDYYNIDYEGIFAPVVTSPYRSVSGAPEHAMQHEAVKRVAKSLERHMTRQQRLLVDGLNVDGRFALAAQKSAINGYLFGNYLSSGSFKFSFTEGEKVRFYVVNLGTYQEQFVHSQAGIGSFDGIHSVHLVNQVFSGNLWHMGKRTISAVVGALPATMTVADMVVRLADEDSGRSEWLMTSGLDLLAHSGQQCLYEVQAAAGVDLPAASGVTRNYFIQIEEVEWNYAPAGRDETSNLEFEANSEAFMMIADGNTIGGAFIGHIYTKARFIEYTDATFTTQVSQPEYLGLLGPIIRADVGDVVRVTLRNQASRAYSIQPNGLVVPKSSEGADYADGQVDGGESVAANGGEYVYTWYVPESSGPGDDDGGSVAHVYQSRTSWVNDPQAGLVGPIIVYRRGSGLSVSGVTKELVVMANMMDENFSPYLLTNIVTKTDANSVAQALNREVTFPFSNWMFNLNGYMFGNMPGLTAPEGQTTRVYFMSVGKTDGGPHSIDLGGGITWQFTGVTEDVAQLMPGMTRAVNVRPRITGSHEVHCHTTVHSTRGMSAFLVVTGVEQEFTSSVLREYHMKAESIRWSYTDNSDYNFIEDRELNDDLDLLDGFSAVIDPIEEWIGQPRPSYIGDPVTKARFVQTEDDYVTEVERPEEWEHLQLLGPVLRAEVGDVIRVNVRNNLNFEINVFPHGLIFEDEDACAPGATCTYTWYVPDSAGPGPNDPSSIAWLYHSRAGKDGDVVGLNAGLFGPIIISENGAGIPPRDVDTEFVVFQSVIEENLSPFPGPPGLIDPEQGSFARPHINGRMWGNNDNFWCKVGDRVRWYILTAGSFSSLHTFHTHAHILEHAGENTDVIELFPSGHATADMIPEVEGAWLFHCHYASHLAQGMAAIYHVTGGATLLAFSPILVATALLGLLWL